MTEMSEEELKLYIFNTVQVHFIEVWSEEKSQRFEETFEDFIAQGWAKEFRKLLSPEQF